MKTKKAVYADMTDAARITRSTAMETASFVLGLIALIGFVAAPVSIPGGALSLIIGALSRGERFKLTKKAKTGMICGAIGLYLALLLVCMVIFFMMKYPVLF